MRNWGNFSRSVHVTLCYSLMVDESTDIATTQTLIFYVRFVSNGEVTTRFLELSKLAGGTAEHILDSLLEVMETRHLPVEKLFGMATDGASVMTGTRSGITTRMKRINPFMLSTHCIAHRLALASGQAADNIPYLKRYQQYTPVVSKYMYICEDVFVCTQLSPLHLSYVPPSCLFPTGLFCVFLSPVLWLLCLVLYNSTYLPQLIQ